MIVGHSPNTYGIDDFRMTSECLNAKHDLVGLIMSSDIGKQLGLCAMDTSLAVF